MNKNTGLQVLMVLVIILISLWFYLKYFTNNFEDVKEIPVIEKNDENQNNTSTYINDINYVSTDLRGNEYQITAKLAEIKVENSDVMFLTDRSLRLLLIPLNLLIWPSVIIPVVIFLLF